MRAKVLVALALVALTVGTISTQAEDLRLQTNSLTAIQLTPQMRLQEFQGVLKQHKVRGQDRTAAMDKFKSLPAGLQNSIVATIKPEYARLVNGDQLVMTKANAQWVRDHLQLAFLISSIWPSQGIPSGWSYAFGTSFNDDCKVYVDGVQVPTYYLDWNMEFFPRSLAFEIPEGASLGVEHAVQARNATAGKQTGDFMYEIIAPRSYRGIWGWKFSNFSDNNIPWHLYSNYFGANSVQYANGTHRPAAQAWYDSAYKGAGGGGNCYGMSVSSLRIRNDNFSHMNWATWLNAPANYHSLLWDYDWQTETKETVQQMQGSWYTQEQLAAYGTADAAQDARGTYNRVAQLVTNSTNRPVLVYWGNGWGHTVVPYAVRVNGDAHEMLIYDNNHPYSMIETGNVDPNVATVNWAANTFSCEGGNSATAVSYEEVTPANPHLPGSEYGGPGSATSVLVVAGGIKVNQITDEGGRRLFNSDGSRNTNPNTSIPNATILYPLVQGPVLRGPLLRGPTINGLQLARRIPADAPTTFVFGSSVGKSLLVSLNGTGQAQCGFFQPGSVVLATTNGAGEMKLNNVLSNTFAVEALNPAGLQLTGVQFIRSTPAGDRLFDLRNLRGLDANTLRLTPLRDGRQLDVQGGPGLQFDLRLEGPIGQGAGVRNFSNVALQANAKLLLQPVNWKQLGTTGLQIQLFSTKTNTLINRTNIGGK